MSAEQQVRRLIALPRVESKFHLTDLLARGGTCDIFKGTHRDLDVPIALKIVNDDCAENDELKARIRYEGRLLSRYRCPYIPQCYDRGVSEDGRPFLVEELLTGETLYELLEKMHTFDELTAIHWGVELCRALEVVHASGVVHRDVTLRNVFIHSPPRARSSELKLIDFALAKRLEEAPADAAKALSVPTDPELIPGTPRYTAPEIVLGKRVDRRADLYSLGICLYAMVCGRDPFMERRSVTAVLEAHVDVLPPPLTRFARDVSPELERIVMCLIQKSPDERFQTAAETAHALLRCGEGIRSQGAVSQHVRVVKSTDATIDLDRVRHRDSRSVFRPGEHCGKYVIKELMDRGGFSEVYEARSTGVPSRSVALKVLKRDFATDEKRREKFLKEIDLLATIRHQHMVTVFEAGEHDGNWWMAMELLVGSNLRHYMQEHPGPLPLEDAFSWALQIAQAVCEAHRIGILHCDLKPDNVFITHKGDACVLDAGLAKLVSETQRKTHSHLNGTIAYISPEALMSLPLDARCDVYSWGHLVIEMLCGRHAYSDRKAPHELPQSMVLALHHLKHPLPSRAELGPHVPREFWSLLERCTSKNVDRRPKNLGEVCGELEQMAEAWASAHYVREYLNDPRMAKSQKQWIAGLCFCMATSAAFGAALAWRFVPQNWDDPFGYVLGVEAPEATASQSAQPTPPPLEQQTPAVVAPPNVQGPAATPKPKPQTTAPTPPAAVDFL